MRTVIEINGRRYDARTGEILEQKISPKNADDSKVAAKQLPTKHRSNGQKIDGFSRRKVPSATLSKQSDGITLHGNKKNIDQSLSRTNVSAISPIKKPQKSKTLLRSIVRKPSTKAAYIHSISGIKKPSIQTSHLRTPIPPSNSRRDPNIVTKSPHISKFATKISHPVKPTLSHKLTIKAHPTSTKPVTSHTPPLTKINISSNDKVTKYDLNHAISVATSHTQKRQKINIKPRVNPKFFIISAGILVIAGLAGYFSYNRVPQLSLQVATSKAGFSGHLPNNAPSGFSLKNPIESTKGSITLNYISNSDARKFAISQKPSNWSSESLLSNVFKQSKLNYQTYQDKGLTIYVYEGNNATWVNNGVWYTITGQNALSSQQLLAIAGSM